MTNEENTMSRLIVFLVRCKLGVRRGQQFRFDNQKHKRDTYFFTATRLMKIEGTIVKESNVRLNWLLNDNCKIEKIKEV